MAHAGAGNEPCVVAVGWVLVAARAAHIGQFVAHNPFSCRSIAAMNSTISVLRTMAPMLLWTPT
ncbi:hypothetical protein FA331_34560 [Pseudomonas aeruginosa]|nr:hypothetical protein [Pseudomonas aeruginosa]MCO2545387.1 hypothetical protein [Pseudomonas aeruginosa]TRO97405.1 hypothetical protein FNL66_33510 [Pseudomonas aeruginosa]HBP5172562.1 hypothetical protein [Pseudomonas aeruginosa]